MIKKILVDVSFRNQSIKADATCRPLCLPLFAIAVHFDHFLYAVRKSDQSLFSICIGGFKGGIKTLKGFSHRFLKPVARHISDARYCFTAIAAGAFFSICMNIYNIFFFDDVLFRFFHTLQCSLYRFCSTECIGSWFKLFYYYYYQIFFKLGIFDFHVRFTRTFSFATCFYLGL